MLRARKLMTDDSDTTLHPLDITLSHPSVKLVISSLAGVSIIYNYGTRENYAIKAKAVKKVHGHIKRK